MMIIKQLKAILQHAIKQYDARKGWLRSASPTNFFAQTIANLMHRQIGDPPLMQELRRIFTALEPLDEDSPVSREQLATVVNCFYMRDNINRGSLSPNPDIEKAKTNEALSV